MATHTNPRSPIDASDLAQDRSEVIYARHQWFGLTVFGLLCFLAALVFAQWNPTTTDSGWFWIIVGPFAGVIAMFRSQSTFGDEGADRDAAPYIGILVGTTLGAVIIGWMGLDGWVLPGVMFVVSAFLAFMAWLEQSAVGMTTALTLTVLTACTAVANLQESVVSLSLMLGFMLLTGALALSVTVRPEPEPEPVLETQP